MSNFQHRKETILNILMKRNYLRTQDIVEILKISEASVRRLMTELEKEPHIKRHYGGIALKTVYHSIQNSSEISLIKQSLAKYVAKNYIKDGQTIFISSGTTTSYLKDYLSSFAHLTIVTNNLLVLNTLLQLPQIEVILLGGIITRDVPATYGSFFSMDQLLQSIVIDTLFVTAACVNERGCSDRNAVELDNMKSIALIPAKQKYLLADHTKIGTNKTFIWSPLSNFTTLITDKHSPKLENLRSLVDIVVIPEENNNTH